MAFGCGAMGGYCNGEEELPLSTNHYVGACCCLCLLPVRRVTDQLMTAIPSTTVSLEVTFAAYLAVLLGTFVPVAFLIILYIQSESRKAGEAAGRGD